MDNIEENIKLLINKDKQSHAKNINLIDLFINYIPLSSPEQTTNPYNIQKLLKKDYEIENVDTSYFHYINENLKNININIVGRPFYRQTHDIINCNSQKETLSKYYQFIVSSGQECYQFLNNYPLFKRASLQKPLIQKREKIEYITALPVSENSKKDKNFLKYELNPSGKEFLLKTNKNIKISTMKLFYTLDNDALRMFELNENDITFNSFIVSIDVYIKYLSNIIITLYPVNLVKLTSNLNNYGQNEEKEEEDLEATLVNKKRSYSDINNGNNSSILKKVKIEENGIGIKEGGEIQTLEKLNLKQKPPLLRIIDNIFNVNYLSLNDLPFSKICNHGQLLFMRENEEKDQYLYIFSSDFALNIASQSSYFDLDIKNNYVHKNKYKFYFDYYSIRVFSNDSIDNSYDYYENYFLKKNDKTKVLQNTSIPVIYALSRNLSSSITLKIILFVLRMNLNYTKKGKYSSFSTSSANSFYTSDGKDIKEDLSFKFNEKTGLSFLNGKYSSEPYHYLWLKDDFISHPSTHFQHQDNKKYGNDNINNNEDEKDLFASSLHFSNENLDASMTSYDIIRFNDNNFNSPNNNELHLTIPINNNGRTSIKDYTREETTSKNKLYLFMKSTKKFIATSYQMDFVPIISINFFMKSLKQRIIQFINQQLYTSSSEFLTFSRKFNHLDHQNSLTYHDFICIPSIMFVLAVKLYYIHPSPKSFALIRLLLMIHIKKQTFLNPSIDNKDYNFFVQALDEFFKMIKEMWGSYYEDEILNNKNYIIHPQLYNRKPHKDLQNIFLNKTKKTLSFRSFINILFGDEIIKYYNEPSSHEIILGKDQDGTIQVTDKNERKYIEKSPDNYGIEDKKSIFKYFSTLYTNHCLANYLLKQCRLNPTASFTLGSPQNNKSKKKYGNNPPVYYQGIYLFLSRKV
ncbi:hypothetical protein BCR36DRAFT_62468 [Piromyces finnis]|uniref:Uncharacterized protein n=1 Tax=Piromyces finnis TaxID=1754191 RepID=A0A1Y1V9D2_9FUNG|nr:hypothetical protein BCR36DRAFT_62468 [Piromyces finnis]|eukprot:ORX49979.1 hypothetical protein BCR36DRAFT_62468 [Piromyces finnis]